MTTFNKKLAVLSMDIEDWYHLDYFNGITSSSRYSYFDGINRYCDILNHHNIPSSFFVLGEIAESVAPILKEIFDEKFELGSHGFNHKRPITIPVKDFSRELIKSKDIIENIIGNSIEGYRASCFSIDRDRLNQVRKAGFKYDSSRIDFSTHPLYKTIDMDGYEKLQHNIYKYKNFFEFQVSTIPMYGRNIPVSGGGYLRMLPWILSEKLIQSYLEKGQLYTLYIHPFELSSKANPIFPSSTSWYNKIRFGLGRSTVSEKLSNLIELLKSNGYSFTTFSSLRKNLLGNKPS